jgi:hypothetical protein
MRQGHFCVRYSGKMEDARAVAGCPIERSQVQYIDLSVGDVPPVQVAAICVREVPAPWATSSRRASRLSGRERPSAPQADELLRFVHLRRVACGDDVQMLPRSKYEHRDAVRA